MSIETIPNGLHMPDGRQPRVAVVDGNSANAMVTAMLATQFGCTVVKAPTGEAALALLRREEPIDLVLIDLAMPDMDGIVAALLIRAMGKCGAMPIVALAARRADIFQPRSRAAGFSGSVLKPYSPRELYIAMESALARAPASASAYYDA
jgi:two-component system, sensor histidine kinase LadS